MLKDHQKPALLPIEKQFKTRIIPYYFFILFAVVGSVNAVMVTLATRTHTGTVTNNPYEKGIHYNRVIDAALQQDELGWKGKMIWENGALSYSLSDKMGKPIKIETVSVQFTRALNDKFDFELALTSNPQKITLPAKGVWDVRGYFLADGNRFQMSERIVVK